VPDITKEDLIYVFGNELKHKSFQIRLGSISIIIHKKTNVYKINFTSELPSSPKLEHTKDG